MIKKKINTLFDLINDEVLERISFVMLLFWAVSPIIEYLLKECFNKIYTHYFTSIIYIIGSIGILIYILYIIKLKIKNKKIDLDHFIPELLMFMLVVLSINSTLVSDNAHLSIFGETYRKEGLIVYIMYIGFALLSSIIKDSKYMKYLFGSMIVSCLVISIVPLFSSTFTYVNFANIFHNTNHYGYYLMINFMLVLFMLINSEKTIYKVIYTLVYIFFICLLIRNNTFGSYLAIFVTLMF